MSTLNSSAGGNRLRDAMVRRFGPDFIDFVDAINAPYGTGLDVPAQDQNDD